MTGTAGTSVIGSIKFLWWFNEFEFPFLIFLGILDMVPSTHFYKVSALLRVKCNTLYAGAIHIVYFRCCSGTRGHHPRAVRGPTVHPACLWCTTCDPPPEAPKNIILRFVPQ